ncbi:hypothetical protein ACL02P_13295 [Paenibacillus sp. MB22_1]|uniref:hypothetical protein n=1 Tax=Paenibacillus sp. MB22_1 TaxID=3383121 RepID=UPI0039A09765
MDINQQKILLLTGINQKIESEIYEVIRTKPEGIVTLHAAGPLIVHQYGDLMRTILLLVYSEGIKDIYVVGVHEQHYNIDDAPNLYDHLYRNLEFRDKLQVIDYLFSSNQIEFPNISLKEWLAGGKFVHESVHRSVEMLRNHPLMPSDVRIYGLFQNEGREIVQFPSVL